MKFNKYLKINTIILFLAINLFSQGVPLVGDQNIPDDPAAETTARRWWYMDGNRVWLKFFNDGMLGNWPDPLSSIWPKGSGIGMNAGLAIIVQSKLNVGPDGIPLPNTTEPDTSLGQGTRYFCQTYFREDMDVDPSGQFNWGFYPVQGYLNLDQDKPAISNDPNSWPIGGWADAPDFVDTIGVTEWNGYFGRGKTNSDLEAYFVTNDAWDLEFQKEDTRLPPYYPRPGKVLPGNNKPWGGLGIRIGARLFQWIHPQVQDVIFVHYDISNISDYDNDQIILSFYIDSDIGEDWSYMDKTLDMSWIFDNDGLGSGNRDVGIMAFAFLESPGIASDGIDNDDDGLIDESRVPLGENERWTDDPLEGVSDPQKFRDFYSSKEPAAHWIGDENQNWDSWEDVDGDGVFSTGIDEINDDVGTDGVSPNDPNYYGPDSDGSEVNGRPDDGEPDYNKTDKDESDQIGLTTFQAWDRELYRGNDPEKDRHFKHDELFWNLTSKGEFNPYQTEGKVNVINLFGSGIVGINSWEKERFSVAELHTWDKPFKNDEFAAPLLFTLKKTVQRVYNANYRFAQPPIKPKLTAIPGDGKVTLIWDNAAEKSKEPFFGYVEDFEGYKIIKSTEPYFEESRTITDGFGTEIFQKPIAQFDLENGKTGFANWGIYNGVSYYLGNDTGIEHMYVDRDVYNGRTYYYAVVAYDFGWEETGLMPVENTAVITLNSADEITFVDRNCAVVIPHTMANGYIPGEIDTNWVIKNGTGTIDVQKINPEEIVEGTRYTIKFSERKAGYDLDKALGYGLRDDKIYNTYNDSLYVIRNGIQNDTIVKQDILGEEKFKSLSFDGLVLDIENDVKPENYSSFWENSDKDITTHLEEARKEGNMTTASTLPEVAWDYSLHFTEDTIYTTSLQKYGALAGMNFLPGIKINCFALNHNFQHKYFDGTDSIFVPDTAVISIVDANKNGKYDWRPNDPFSDYIMIGEFDWVMRKDQGDFFDLDYCVYAYSLKFLDAYPDVGAIYRIFTQKPFSLKDEYQFELTKTIDFDKSVVDMDQIKVVPNPYVGSNMMEPQVRAGLNQRRRIMFTHIPAQCKISIYSLNGYLVDEIKVNNDVSDGKVFWEMQTKEGLEVSYGLYIYRVEAPGIGAKTGKFAIIK